MAIRITGMYSGLDTESIINQLASAQSTKKNSLVKAQTKLSWKQDAWKALNTKIFSFYTNVLSDMRFEGSYMSKVTKASNSNAVSVVTSADAPNSVQTMKINQLAKQGYMTGAELKTMSGQKVSGNTTLADLGFVSEEENLEGKLEGKFRVKAGNKTTDITVTGDMKLSELVNKLQSAGINASFDAKNQRLYLNSKSSGAAADFTITANNADGLNALTALGLMSAYDPKSHEAEEYAKWASYGTDPDARKKAEEEELAKLIAAKKASTDALLTANENYQKRLDDLIKDNEENSKYEINYVSGDDVATNAKKLRDQAAALYDQLYGEEVEVQKKDENGNPVVDDDNNPVMVKERNGGLKNTLDEAKKALEDAQKDLDDLKKNGASETDIQEAQKKVNEKSDAVTTAQSNFNKMNAHYSYVNGASNIQNAIENNNKTIAENETYYTVDADDKPIATDKAKDEITAYFDKKIATAAQYKASADAAKEAGKTATKVDGQDSVITLNNVQYTNSTNTFEINGLTITAQLETGDEEITLTTAEDTEGIYNKIKNFFTEYNKLINEMDALYNADSSKGYEPLLSEEKDGLADSEIEEWEKKIKDSLLRRDATLRDVSDAMKTILLQGATVNGKKMYLSDFGINTLGYFKSADNEKNAYHINGDKEDSAVSAEDDTLRAMIAADPETVQKFFSGLSKNLYEKLTEKMQSVKDTSSAFTVYNDKTMQKEYDDYKDRISKEEKKLNNLIDSWYSKFSAMETAMAKLQSKNNAVSSMFGG